MTLFTPAFNPLDPAQIADADDAMQASRQQCPVAGDLPESQWPIAEAAEQSCPVAALSIKRIHRD